MMTLSEAIRSRGWDPEEIFEERAEELRLMRELGVPSDVEPVAPSASPDVDPNAPEAPAPEPHRPPVFVAPL